MAILLATSAYAGGSLFGHKAKTVNTNGVHSIGVHICGSLECPPVRIFQGKCNQDHMSMHWGVCVCDKGYVPRNGKCDACPEGQYSDGITECKSCPDGMYAEAGDTKCIACPTPTDTICNGTPEVDSHNCPTQELVECSGTTPVCKADNKTCECPDNADCTITPWTCNDGYYRTGVEGFDKIVDACVPCPDANATKCNGDGISTECKDGYEVEGDVCVEVPSCTLTTIDCPAGVDVTNCVCESTEGQTCDDHTANQCGLGYYCQFSPSECSDSDRGNGTCTKITGGTKVDGHWVGPSLDWWSANSWCIGKGSSGSITYATLKSEYSCDKSGYSCDFDTMKDKGLTEHWSAEVYENSCFAWFVVVDGGYYANDFRERNLYALCE